MEAEREVVSVGLDGRSQPMLRYRDELHLADHLRSIVTVEHPSEDNYAGFWQVELAGAPRLVTIIGWDGEGDDRTFECTLVTPLPRPDIQAGYVQHAYGLVSAERLTRPDFGVVEDEEIAAFNAREAAQEAVFQAQAALTRATEQHAQLERLLNSFG